VFTTFKARTGLMVFRDTPDRRLSEGLDATNGSHIRMVYRNISTRTKPWGSFVRGRARQGMGFTRRTARKALMGRINELARSDSNVFN